MNESEIVDAQIVMQDVDLPVWKRTLLAIGLAVILAAIGGMVWIFGILMFTFSLDGASSSDLPDWLDGFMLVGWPATIAIFTVVPPILMAVGVKWQWVFASAIGTGFLSMATFVTGVVVVLWAVSQ